MVTKLDAKFSITAGAYPTTIYATSDRGPIQYMATLSKVLATISVLMVHPEWSECYIPYLYVVEFWTKGGFQNLGAGLMLGINFFLEEETPYVY